ncbi:MAG: hypothetical protein IPK13_03235 [Deltaproteobacteria bacterium]|nr:hypothetical protein [Deltaproteobacteria bacterium]
MVLFLLLFSHVAGSRCSGATASGASRALRLVAAPHRRSPSPLHVARVVGGGASIVTVVGAHRATSQGMQTPRSVRRRYIVSYVFLDQIHDISWRHPAHLSSARGHPRTRGADRFGAARATWLRRGRSHG